LGAEAVEIRFEPIDEDARRAYERFFFERICSMSTTGRQDLTVPLPQIEGLYFTSVQDTVERLTDLSGRLSKFQWRNCIFAPIGNSNKPKDVYEEVFRQLKSKAPSLFVRSYVYLIFIRLESNGTSPFDFGDAIQPTAVRPSADDYQIYYWNTKYEVRPGRKKNLFGDSGNDVVPSIGEHGGGLDEDEASGIENDPKKLFIVQNPAHELQRIQDANSDIIDAFNNSLPLVDQTESYLNEIAYKLDKNPSARVLVEGPARSGKTVLAMSLLARYPKSKMLLMNWYFYDALRDAFKIWAELSKDEIEQLFAMPKKVRERVSSGRIRQAQFLACQADQRVLNVVLRAMDIRPGRLPRWSRYVDGRPAPGNGRDGDWRATPVIKSAIGDLVPVLQGARGEREVQVVEVIQKHDDGSATVERLSGVPRFTTNADQKAWLLEYKSQIEAGRGTRYIAEILKDIADALHESDQRFFHHNLEQQEGCWIERGNPTTCNISAQDLVICDEVQRLGVIPDINDRDRFDETREIFKSSRQSFLCGDDFQMLNPSYDKGMGAIKRIAGKSITRLKLPDSVGVPAAVGELIKYLLDEHSIPKCSSGFEIQLLHNDDIGLVELFEADGSTKKHYAIPNSIGFYRSEPCIRKTATRTKDCTPECPPNCKHQSIPMLREDLRKKFKFFCSEAVMPNFALSAYELISREVESVYLKIPQEIGLSVVQKPIAPKSDGADKERNWKKQHLYVLMTRATMRLVINVEDRALYEHFHERLGLVNCPT
jgi:hypothetical protein